MLDLWFCEFVKVFLENLRCHCIWKHTIWKSLYILPNQHMSLWLSLCDSTWTFEWTFFCRYTFNIRDTLFRQHSKSRKHKISHILWLWKYTRHCSLVCEFVSLMQHFTQMFKLSSNMFTLSNIFVYTYIQSQLLSLMLMYRIRFILCFPMHSLHFSFLWFLYKIMEEVENWTLCPNILINLLEQLANFNQWLNRLIISSMFESITLMLYHQHWTLFWQFIIIWFCREKMKALLTMVSKEYQIDFNQLQYEENLYSPYLSFTIYKSTCSDHIRCSCECFHCLWCWVSYEKKSWNSKNCCLWWYIIHICMIWSCCISKLNCCCHCWCWCVRKIKPHFIILWRWRWSCVNGCSWCCCRTNFDCHSICTSRELALWWRWFEKHIIELFLQEIQHILHQIQKWAQSFNLLDLSSFQWCSDLHM